MKRKIISTILAFLLTQPMFCLAYSSSSENGEDGIETNFEIINEDNTTFTGIQDDISLYDEVKEIPANSNVSIGFCKLSAEGYDLSAKGYVDATGTVGVDCGEDSEFRLSVTNDASGLTIESANGTAFITGIPVSKKFNIMIENDMDESINCATQIVGSGFDLTPEPGFPIFLDCIGSSAKSVISGIIAAILLLI